ncbi:MAG TPA: hypothetical protein VFA44_01820 [Gaiellaceae bacterium]|nr:hypothetical protein [Gaiellaceae bacterium]
MNDRPNSRPRLGEILLARGLITEGGLRRALEQQARTGELLGQILAGRGWLSPEELDAALDAQRASPPAPAGVTEAVLDAETALPADPAVSLRARIAAETEQQLLDVAVEDSYVVREAPSGRTVCVAATFLDAADAAFAAIDERDPERVDIVHARGGERELVWTYRREGAA